MVRDYLIAHTLKDCSFILDIAATQNQSQSQLAEQHEPRTLPLEYAWQCESDVRLGGVYSVQVIDLDRKHVENIPRYAQLDADIALCYNACTMSTTGSHIERTTET